MEASSVRPETQRRYRRYLSCLAEFLRLHTLPRLSNGAWDETLCEYFEALYLEGKGSATAANTLSALVWAQPSLGRPVRVALPRAHQAWKGWQLASPGSSRPPLPWVVAAAMAAHLARRGQHEAALCLLLLFTLYLRPSECLALHQFQLLEPLPALGPGYDRWSVLVHARELGRPGKTGEFDDTVVLDQPDLLWLDEPLRSLRAARAPGEPLWSLDYEDLRGLFNGVVAELGLEAISPSLYALRHGGASHDRAMRFRSLEEVSKRGRWRSAMAVRCYEKHGRLAAQANKLPPATLERCRQLAALLPRCFEGPCAPHWPPTGWAGSASSSRSSQEAAASPGPSLPKGTPPWRGTSRRVLTST